MWRWEDVKMWRCEDVKMTRRCEDEQMWRCEDVKMWRWLEDVKMWRCEDVKMSRRCEDEQKMWRWEGVKMWRWETDPHYWKNPALRRSREQTFHKMKQVDRPQCKSRTPVARPWKLEQNTSGQASRNWTITVHHLRKATHILKQESTKVQSHLRFRSDWPEAVLPVFDMPWNCGTKVFHNVRNLFTRFSHC